MTALKRVRPLPLAPPLLLRRVGLVTPGQDEVVKADVLISGGRIGAVGPELEGRRGLKEADAEGLWLMPGLCDVHVHLREPGGEHKETVATGSGAAVRAGFTTLCSMANTQPTIDSAERLGALLQTISTDASCRVLPMASLTQGLQGVQLTDIAGLAKLGAVAFSDDGRTIQDAALMGRAMAAAAEAGRRVHDHCESESLSGEGSAHEGAWARALGLPTAPARAEEAVIARDIALASREGVAVHCCHVSTAAGADLLRAAQQRGTEVSGEVTPHHLALDESWLGRSDAGGFDAARGYTTFAKVNPPLRAATDCVALRAALMDGTLRVIATDHAPHTLEEKAASWQEAPSGISGLDTALPVVLELVRAGVLSLGVVTAALTRNPHSLLPSRWRLAMGPATRGWTAGTHADLTIVDPLHPWTVSAKSMWSKSINTPLLGGVLRGRAVATLVSGRIGFADPALASDWGWARLVDERGLALSPAARPG